MKFYLLTAAAAAAMAAAAAVVVAVTAAAAVTYDSASLPAAGVLSSPYFLWAVANFIVVFLFSSHHRGHAAGDEGDVDMGMSYTSSSGGHHEHELGDDVFAVAAAADLAVVAAPAVTTKKKQPPRAAKRSTDRPRARKSSAGGEMTPAVSSPRVETPRAAVADGVIKRPIVVEEDPWLGWTLAAATSTTVDATPDVKKSAVEEEWPDWAFFVEEAPDAKKPPLVDEDEFSAWALACTTAAVEKPVIVEEVKPLVNGKKASDDEWAITVATTGAYSTKPDDDVSDDVSMDSMWETILQRGARPVTVRKSDTWAPTTDERRRRDRAAESAVAARKEIIRKSATTATNMTPPPSPQHARAPPAPARKPWRTRDALPAMPNDELMRRAESLIRRHHEQLRLQRQESEQRQALELQRRRPLIRVARRRPRCTG